MAKPGLSFMEESGRAIACKTAGLSLGMHMHAQVFYTCLLHLLFIGLPPAFMKK